MRPGNHDDGASIPGIFDSPPPLAVHTGCRDPVHGHRAPGGPDTRWQKDGPLPYDGFKGGVKAPARAGLNLDAPIVE